jgi:hypothetical protein
MMGFLEKSDQWTQTHTSLIPNTLTSARKNATPLPKNHGNIHNDPPALGSPKAKALELHYLSSQNKPSIPATKNSSILKITDPTVGSYAWVLKSAKNLTNENVKSEPSVVLTPSKRGERTVSPGVARDKFKFVPTLRIF